MTKTTLAVSVKGTYAPFATTLLQYICVRERLMQYVQLATSLYFYDTKTLKKK